MYFIKILQLHEPCLDLPRNKVFYQKIFQINKWDVSSRVAEMAWDVLSGVTKTPWDVLSRVSNFCGIFCLGCQKMAWDVLSGCFVLHSRDFIPNTYIVALYYQQVIKQQRQNILYIFMHL